MVINLLPLVSIPSNHDHILITVKESKCAKNRVPKRIREIVLISRNENNFFVKMFSM